MKRTTKQHLSNIASAAAFVAFVALVTTTFTAVFATKAHALTLTDLTILTVALPATSSVQRAYLARTCPPNVWKINAAKTQIVCCNGYKTDDGIADGSCVTRALVP